MQGASRAPRSAPDPDPNAAGRQPLPDYRGRCARRRGRRLVTVPATNGACMRSYSANRYSTRSRSDVKALPTIETVDSAIQRLMRPSEVRRHQVRVVQVRQRRARVGGASVENGLREPLQRRGVRVGEAARQGESPNSRKLFHDTAYNDASAGGRRYY